MTRTQLLSVSVFAIVASTCAGMSFAQGNASCEGCPEMIELPSGSAMSATPVTVGQFKIFAQETNFLTLDKCFIRTETDFRDTEGMSWEFPGFLQEGDHPVVCVSWLDATAYADWLSEKTGEFYRLPTIEEYVEATRAGGATEFWWGDDFSEVCSYANSADINYRAAFPEDPRTTVECDDGYSYTSPVKAFPPNAYGLHDMAGNIWQWTNSCLEGDCSNALFRGAAWTVPNPRHFRIDAHFADRILLKNSANGFRLMRDPE